jgi:hypothetical protein
MAESLLVRKAGGGAKINGKIKNYTVATGFQVNAGDFVDYGLVEITQSLDIVLEEGISNNDGISLERISQNKLLFHYKKNTSGENGTFFARVLVLNEDNTITIGDLITLYAGNDVGQTSYREYIITYQRDNQLLLSWYSATSPFKNIKHRAIKINNDNTISLGQIVTKETEYFFGSMRYITSHFIPVGSTTDVSRSMIIRASSNSSNALQTHNIEINWNTLVITMGDLITININNQTMQTWASVRINPQSVLICYGGTNSGVIEAISLRYNSINSITIIKTRTAFTGFGQDQSAFPSLIRTRDGQAVYIYTSGGFIKSAIITWGENNHIFSISRDIENVAVQSPPDGYRQITLPFGDTISDNLSTQGSLATSEINNGLITIYEKQYNSSTRWPTFVPMRLSDGLTLTTNFSSNVGTFTNLTNATFQQLHNINNGTQFGFNLFNPEIYFFITRDNVVANRVKGKLLFVNKRVFPTINNKVIGVAKTDGTAGQTVEVFVKE